jgi:hypothetical protein
MNIELHLSESMQAALSQHAAATGKSIDELIQEAVEQRVSELEVSQSELPANEWSARLRKWAASHPVQGHYVDVDRESIYRGRGE